MEIKTLNDLKEFLNSLSDEQLSKPAIIANVDEPFIYLTAASVCKETFYVHYDENEDQGPLETLKEVHGDEFDIEDYEVLFAAGDVHFETGDTPNLPNPS